MLKTCKYCPREVTARICPSCWQKRQVEAVRKWRERPVKTEEVEETPFVPVVMANRETMYYPWKLDPSVVLVVEP